MPVSCLDVLIDTPVRGGLPEYDGKNMEVIQVLLDFMEKRIDKVNPQTPNRETHLSPGKAKTTWRRSTEQEFKQKGLTWRQLERMDQDRRGWRRFINGLCFKRNTTA